VELATGARECRSLSTKQRAGWPALWALKVLLSNLWLWSERQSKLAAFLRSRQLFQDGLEVRDGRISKALLYKLRRISHCNVVFVSPSPKSSSAKRRQRQPTTTTRRRRRRIESFPLLKLKGFGAVLKLPTCSMIRELSAPAVTPAGWRERGAVSRLTGHCRQPRTKWLRERRPECVCDR